MPSVKDILSASAIALFTATNAHMTLNTPKPYGNPNSSPLDASGSDFPCKSSTNSGGEVTEMPVGSTQQLSFKGSAVHGGGSCQISLTTDNPATKQSKWMVIHSIEGGCPSAAGGNLADAPQSTSSADTFPYKIPDGIKPGTYTLAWTWFNKIGNREMYMNCANVKVTGGSKKRDTFTNHTYAIPQLSERDTSFPSLFVANIGQNGCKTAEGVSVQFPDPGSSVVQMGDKKLGPPTGQQCSAGSGGVSAGVSTPTTNTGADQGGAGGSGAGGSGAGGSGAGGSGAGSGSNSSPGGQGSGTQASTSGSQVDTTANASSGNPGAGAAPAASSAAPSAGGNASSGSSSSAAPAATAAPAAPAAQASAAQGAPAAAGSSSTTCTQAGKSICSPDGRQIGTCDTNLKVSMTPVPASTVCRDGVISWPNKQKRSSRVFANGYVRRNLRIGGYAF